MGRLTIRGGGNGEAGQSWLYYTIYSTVIFLLIYRKRSNLKAFVYLTFTIYTLNLLTFVLFPLPVHASTLEWLREITPYPYIVGPLTDFRVWLATTSTPGLLRFLIKRVVLFLPLGLYLPLIFPKLNSLVKLALAGFLTALGMESPLTYPPSCAPQ